MLDLRKSHKVLDVRSVAETLNLPVDTLIVSLLQISSLARDFFNEVQTIGFSLMISRTSSHGRFYRNRSFFQEILCLSSKL